MKISPSEQGIKFITNFEGFRAIPYRDSGGLLTVGYGQRISEAQGVKMGAGITKEAAHDLLAAYLERECKVLSALPLANLLQHQQDAVISLVYNIGYRSFLNSTIYQRLTTRAIDLTPWLWFTKDAKGQRLQGLVTRRMAELSLFIYGQY